MVKKTAADENMKILVAEIYGGGMMGGLTESKGSFTLQQAIASLATVNAELTKEDPAFVEENGPLTFADDEVLHKIFFDDGPLAHMFEPEWSEFRTRAKGHSTFETVLKAIARGKPVIINGEETTHGLVLDNGDKGLKKELMRLTRQGYNLLNGDDDDDGW